MTRHLNVQASCHSVTIRQRVSPEKGLLAENRECGDEIWIPGK